MEEAFTKLTDYLDAHPGEFYVIHLFRGNVPNAGSSLTGGKNSDSDRETYNRLFNEFFNQGKFADYIVDYQPDLKVKDIRGKMVIFRRDRIEFAHVAKGGNLTNWPADDEQWSEGSYTTVTNASNRSIQGIARVTDVSSPSKDQLELELSSIRDLYNYSRTQIRPNEAKRAGTYKPFWTMIFTSGEYDGSGRTAYLKNATHTNPFLTSLIKEAESAGPVGTVFSDWVLTDEYSGYKTMGVELIPTIYESNFKYIQEFILDDELFTEETGGDDQDDVNYWESDTEYFFKNVATGELLAAGANWGTHAALGKYGLRIKPVYNEAGKYYELKTTAGYIGPDEAHEYYIDYGTPAIYKAKYVGNGHFAFVTVDGTEAMGIQPTSGFYDGTQYVVNPVTPDIQDPMQQWELIPVDNYFKNQTAIASPSNPQDISYVIRGHRFIPNDGDNPNSGKNSTWKATTNSGKYWNKTYSSEIKTEGVDIWNDKDLILHCYNESASGASKYTNWSLSNTFSGLPAGDYTLSFKAIQHSDFYGNGESYVKINGTNIKDRIVRNNTTNAADVVNMFRNDTNGQYDIVMDFTLEDNGSISFDMYKPGTAKATHLFIGDITLMYMGKPVKVEWTMEGAQYDAIMLPFEAECPEGLTLYEADENDVTYNNTHSIINLSESKVAGRIEANKPYFVKAEGNVNSRAAGMQGTTFTFEGYPEYESDTYTSGLLTGTHNGTALGKSQHVMLHGAVGNESNTSWFDMAANDEDKYVAPHHAYIDTANFPAQTFNGYKIFMENHPGNGDNDVTTGIEGISDDAEAGIVDVYSLTGVKLRSNVSAAEALEGLEPGVYVIRQNGNGSARLKAKNK